MSARSPRAGAPRKGVGSETYESIFGLVYVGLATNLLLVVATLPLLVLLMTTDPATSWPALAVVAPVAAPALVAAFAVFGAHSADGSTTAVRTFARAYRHHLRRSLAVGALTSAVVVVLVVDVAAVWGARIGALAIPVFVTLLVLAVATAVVALVAVPELPGTRLRDLLRVSLFVAVRRWYVSAAALAVLGLLAGVVVARPAIGLGVTAAPLLFAVWGSHRYALRAQLRAVTPPAPAS
ncbi:hypothetical protein GCM10009718_18380 [Isoptericola halotolerans]|uniref:Membrane protein YesL n=1 Tax=Isoptericola halotolerans TaxID=300560 RepID=A0ABX2A6T9_9MICO|nr:DUF624 domain-containing protein [Isoptericola halotolerans]NOV98575.1 putative membrane protein YesL [Isoptericola halotolerans]